MANSDNYMNFSQEYEAGMPLKAHCYAGNKPCDYLGKYRIELKIKGSWIGRKYDRDNFRYRGVTLIHSIVLKIVNIFEGIFNLPISLSQLLL